MAYYILESNIMW